MATRRRPAPRPRARAHGTTSVRTPKRPAKRPATIRAGNYLTPAAKAYVQSKGQTVLYPQQPGAPRPAARAPAAAGGGGGAPPYQPVQPFLTGADIINKAQFEGSIGERLAQGQQDLAEQGAQTDYQRQALHTNLANTNRNIDENAAARGIFRSSVRAVSLADAQKAATQQEMNLDNMLTLAQNKLAGLRARIDTVERPAFYAGLNQTAIENAAGVNAAAGAAAASAPAPAGGGGAPARAPARRKPAPHRKPAPKRRAPVRGRAHGTTGRRRR